MKELKKLDSIQMAFLELTASIGLTIEDMNAEIREDAQCEWSIYYETSLDEQYNYDLSKLLTYFEIFRIARKNNDELTAFVALLHAGTSSQNLKSLFENIENEIDKVMFRDPRFKWPEM